MPNDDEELKARKREQSKLRARRRFSPLNKLAREQGYSGFSEFCTMAKNGEVALPPCPRKEPQP